MNFESLPKHDILKLPLNQLDIEIEGSWVQPLVEQVFSELNEYGISWRPHIWVSNEWFCPDGVPGVAIPFYLFSKKLIKMEKEYVGFIEGHTEKSFLKLFRHEVGHAFDNAFKCRDSKKRHLIFGNSKLAYKNYYTPMKYSSSYVKHLPLNYAQAHPDEDFAETFAFVLSRQHLESKNTNKNYLEKIKFMSSLFKKASLNKAKLTNKYKVEDISKDNNSLQSYYVKRRSDLKLENDSYDKFLTCLSKNKTSILASKYICDYKSEIKKEVSSYTGLYKYEFDSVLDDFESYLRREKFFVKDKLKAKTEIKDLLVYKALDSNVFNKRFF